MYGNICHQIYADEFWSEALPGTPAVAIVAVPEFSAFIYESGLQDVLVFLYNHTLKHWLETQPVVEVDDGETEVVNCRPPIARRC